VGLVACTDLLDLDRVRDGAGGSPPVSTQTGMATGSSSSGSGSSGSGASSAASGSTTTSGGAGAPPSSYANRVKADGPIAYYRFEANPGLLEDEGGMYPATATPPVGPAPGLIGEGGEGLALTGGQNESYLRLGGDFPGAFAGTSPFSVECWFQATDNYGRLIRTLTQGGTVGWELRYNSSGALMLRSFDSGNGTSVQSLDQVTASSIYHLVGTYDGANLCVYVNASATCKPDAVSSGAGMSVTIGDDVSGVMDEVAIYDKALAPADVAAHYQAGVP
jgi:hypothetical protein